MKTVKTLAITLAILAVPSMSLAMGCNYGTHSKQAQSCAAGSSWDDTAKTCVPVANS